MRGSGHKIEKSFKYENKASIEKLSFFMKINPVPIKSIGNLQRKMFCYKCETIVENFFGRKKSIRLHNTTREALINVPYSR